MKRIPLLIIFLSFGCIVAAQPGNEQRIQDSIIGWEKIYNFKGRQYKPVVVDGQTFSPCQQSLRDSFISWFQRTYTPIGGQGTVYDRNQFVTQKKFPLPQGIGIDFLVWNVMFDNTGKALRRISETWTPVFIYTNNLAGLNEVEMLVDKNNYYFTMPRRNYESTFTDPGFVELVKDYGLHNGDRFSKYLVYFTGTHVTVVLIPGNKLPIVQLTKGEVIDLLEKRLPEAIQKYDAEYQSYARKNMNAWKEKYRNRRNEPAVFKMWRGPAPSDFATKGDPPEVFIEDATRGNGGEGYSAYKYENGVLEASKKDQPLWVAITWQPQKPVSLNKQRELHNAMLRYFNFDYVYDYFFNPAKIKGQPYTVSNAAEQAAKLQELRSHWALQTNTANKQLAAGVHFYDDFSSNAIGSRPAGWNDNRNREQATTVSVNNQPGKWIRLGHLNEWWPATSLKKPLPANYSLEFDVVSDDFDARTGGAVDLNLGTYELNADGLAKPNAEGLRIIMSLTSGNENDYNNNNYRGGAEIKITRTSPSINVWHHSESLSYTYGLREFTNKKNRIHVMLQVMNGAVSLYINDRLVVKPGDFTTDDGKPCNQCGFANAPRFRNISFTNKTYNWDPNIKEGKVKVYISNVKITSL